MMCWLAQKYLKSIRMVKCSSMLVQFEECSLNGLRIFWKNVQIF